MYRCAMKDEEYCKETEGKSIEVDYGVYWCGNEASLGAAEVSKGTPSLVM